MSEHINDRQPEKLKTEDEQSLLQKYLQNPFSVTWSKLAALLVPTRLESDCPEELLSDYRSEPQEPDYNRDRDLYPLYPRFTDRVDPSLYYSIFFPHQRY